MAAFLVGAAVVLVPIALSSNTPYALDIKWLISGACALLAGLALLVRWAAGGQFHPKTAAMTRVLGLFLCAVALSLAFSHYRLTSLRETWWYAAHAILFIATAAVFRRRGWAALLVGAIIVTATFVAISGCLQAYGIDMLGKTWWKGGRKVLFGPGTRVLGTIGLETPLGGYMATCAVLALGAMLCAGRLVLRICLGAAAFLMIACMVLSGTRTAWFAFLVGLVVLAMHLDLTALKEALRARAGKTALVIAGAVVICAAAWFAPTVWRRTSELPRHLSTRTTIWHAALGMFYDSPVLGKGPGTFKVHFAEFRPPDYARHRVGAITVRAHSEYFEVLAETGMLGTALFAIFIGLFALGSVRALNGPSAGNRRALLLAAFAAAITMLVQASASVSTRYPTCRMTLWVMMGLTVALWRDDGPTVEPLQRPATRVWRAAVVIAAALAAAVIWPTQVHWPYMAREHLSQAKTSQKLGNWRDSAKSARRALELDPASVPSRYVLANSLFYAGRYRTALDAFDQLRKYSPNYADIHLRMAVLNARLDRMDKARDALRLADRYGMLTKEFARGEALTDGQLESLSLDYERREKAR